MRYFFRVEYDGTGYGGWQRQDNAPSIQAEVERAFSTVTRAPCAVTGAGRTDAGVHARAQGAHVDIANAIEPAACEASVNAVLPSDVAIYRLQPVNDTFHARYSAQSRKYRYYSCERKLPLHYNRVWQLRHAVMWDAVAHHLEAVRGTHDFSTFCAAGNGLKNALCTVTEARLDQEGEIFVFTIAANRFVYTMVRSLWGTLIDIGRGRITHSLADLLASRDRSRAGRTAPACGLVLDFVTYPEVF
jgi:tRNA pseudouridine38-40 synthase